MPSRNRAFMEFLIAHSRKTIEGLGIAVPQP